MEANLAWMLLGTAAIAVVPQAAVAGLEALWRNESVRRFCTRYCRAFQ